MKRLLICLLVFVLSFSVFAFPAAAYTERKSFSKGLSWFEMEFDEAYGFSHNAEIIGDGEYNDFSWEFEYLLNLMPGKKAYFYIDLPEEYHNCKVRFFTNKNPDNTFYVTLDMVDGSRVNTSFKVNEYVSFPDDVKTLIFPLPYNESIGEISFYYDVDFVAQPSDIGYAKDIFSKVFGGFWNTVKDNWLAAVLLCLPLAFGLIMLVIKIINSFGSVRLGNIRFIKLGNLGFLKLGNVKTVGLKDYKVNTKKLNVDVKSRLRKGYTIVEVDGNKFIKKIKDNHAEKRK